MKKIVNTPLIDPFTDKPLQVGVGETNGKPLQRDLMTAHAIRSFLLQAFNPQVDATGRRMDSPPSITDSHHALRVLDALRPFKLLEACFENPPKHIALEDADYDWLLKSFESRANLIYGIVSEVFIEAVKNLHKVDEPKAREEATSDDGAKPRLVKTK